jgi:predicted RNA-binding Zn-ribbon protein involved in translation (DUF1610 family)
MMITVKMVCPMCGNEHEVVCDSVGYNEWILGELIQNTSLFTTLTDVQREQLITDLCPECIEEMYSSCDDEDEDWEEPWNLDEGFDPYMGEYTWDC